jgi:hypothetical protein
MQVRILNPSASKIFDLERSIQGLIMPYSSGKVKMMLILAFEDPFQIDAKIQIPLYTETLQIEE